MIVYVEGKIEEKSPARVTVDVGGIGYGMSVPMSTYDKLPAVGQKCRLLTHDYIREDQHSLFAFATVEERDVFEFLMSVNGIGAKLALSALSCLSVRDIKKAIADGDAARLSCISGVGKRMAERIVVELKDKVSDEDGAEPGEAPVSGGSDAEDAAMALVSLGYKLQDARRMVATVLKRTEGQESVEDIVRSALGGKRG